MCIRDSPEQAAGKSDPADKADCKADPAADNNYRSADFDNRLHFGKLCSFSVRQTGNQAP